MAQLNDCKHTALRAAGYVGSVSDMLLQWAQANGGISGDVSTATLQALKVNGATSDNISDAWHEALVALGIAAGSRNDMELEFWCIYNGVFGEIILPPDALLDETTLQALLDETTTQILLEE